MTNESGSKPSLGPLPLVVGIVGHLDLSENNPQIQARVEQVIQEEIINKYPNTPLLFLSSLAEGADRLVVRVMKEKFRDRSSFFFPLPLPKEEYKKDFEKKNTGPQFEELLNLPRSHYIELPLVPGNTPENIRDPDQIHRKLQYALGGVYIARQSQILIALYDGKPTKKVGGTSYTVQFALEGEFEDKSLQEILEQVPEPYKPRLSPLNPPETGPVYRIPVTREEKDAQQESAVLEKLYNKAFEGKQKEAENYYDRIYGLMNEFNKDTFLVENNSKLRASAHLSEERLVHESEISKPVPSDLLKMKRNFAIADTLAIHFQKGTYRIFRYLCGFVFLSAIFFETYTHFLNQSAKPWPLAVSNLLLALAGLAYWGADHKKYQNKFQDYRALAEGLRVQLFWRLSGLKNSVADHYLRKQMSELEWIPNAIRNWSIPQSPEWIPNKYLVKSHWIEDQVVYFGNAAWLNHFKLLIFDVVSFICFTASSLILLYLMTHDLSEKTGPDWILFVCSAVAVLLALYAFLQAWHEAKAMLEEKDSLREEAEGMEWRITKYSKLVGQLFQAIVFRVFFSTMLPVAVLYFFSSRGMLLLNPDPERITHGILILVLLLLALNGGLHHFYAQKMAWVEHIKQYKRMILFFENARNRFDKLGDSGILDLGREALAENGDWVWLHRERPLEVPHH